MAIVKINNPVITGAAYKTIENTYGRQNNIISYFMSLQNAILGNGIRYSYVSNTSTLTIQKNSVFEFFGELYVIDSDTVLTPAKQSSRINEDYYYLIYNSIRNTLEFVENQRPQGRSVEDKGYFADQQQYKKYLGLVVVYYYKGNKASNGQWLDNYVVKMRHYSEGETYIRFQGMPSPLDISFSQFTDVSEYFNGVFFRAYGKNAGFFQPTRQPGASRFQYDAIQNFNGTLWIADDNDPTGAFVKTGRSGDGADGNASNADIEVELDLGKGGARTSSETRPRNESIRLYVCTSSE